jgi:cell wall-associated NlpC family hydrolase/uncharacterized membrane protein YsdA (DUF1294 family)
MEYFGIIYGIINGLTFFIYGLDKVKAMNNRYRIPEKVLLMWAFFGPIGGFLGMQLFRHKTKKTKFKVTVPLFLFLHIFIFVFANPVNAAESEPSAWAVEEFNEAQEKGYITENLYDNLQENISREEFIELIVTAFEKMFGQLDSVSLDENTFKDTENIHAVKGYVLGLIQGNNGYFYPDQKITREEMIVIFIRLSDAIELRAEVELLSKSPTKFEFTDNKDISDWAQQAMKRAVSNGLVRGTESEDGGIYLNPKSLSTKEEAILLNLRLFKNFENNKELKAYIDDFVEATEKEKVVEEVVDVSMKKSIESEEPISEKIGSVTTEVLRMRSAPSLDNSDNIIGKLTMNQQVTIKGQEGEWYLVRTQNAIQGYAHQDYIRILSDEEVSMTKSINEAASGDVDQLIAYAKQFVGTPYRYGGTSLSKGIDCSSFTQQIYAPYGVSLNRSSRDQYLQGSYVDKNELLPGDLLFYGQSGRVSHVAIYMGDGQSIHATTTSGVRITPAFGWMSRLPFIGAKRVL